MSSCSGGGGGGSSAASTAPCASTSASTSPPTPRNTSNVTSTRGPGSAPYSNYTASGGYYSVHDMGRTCSVDSGLSEATGQLRGLSLSTAGDPHTDPHQHSPAYLLPRHYPQAVYYVPGGGVSSGGGGTIKYVYPQPYPHQPQPPHPSQAGAGGVSVMGAGAGGMTTVPPNPPVDPSIPTITPGAGSYLPGGYTMMSYPGGMVATSAPRAVPAATAQESGGTTYYCPAQPHTAPLPPPQSTVSPVSHTHQYPMTPTSAASSAYPQLVGSLGYYGAGMYPATAAAPGTPAAAAAAAAGAVYAAAAAAAGSSVHGSTPHHATPSQHYHRPATPPHTTQSVYHWVF